MNRSLKSEDIVFAAALLLMMLWAYAAVSKLADPLLARAQMLNQVFPKRVSLILLWAVPTTELCLVALLLVERTRVPGLYLSAGLLAAFSIYIVLVMSRAFGRIPCSCGGILNNMPWGAHLLFNLCFLLVAVCGLAFKERRLIQNEH